MVQAYLGERNLRVQCAAGWGILGLAWVVGLAPVRLAVLIVAVGVVLAAEIVNTAVESVVDLVAPGPDPLAGAAKDSAAGAVLTASLAAVAAGAALFWPLWLHPLATLRAGWVRHPWIVALGGLGEACLTVLACGRLGGPRR